MKYDIIYNFIKNLVLYKDVCWNTYLLKLACILVGNIFGITDVDSVTVHNTAVKKEKNKRMEMWVIDRGRGRGKRMN